MATLSPIAGNSQSVVKFSNHTATLGMDLHKKFRYFYIHDVNNDTYPDLLALPLNRNSSVLYTFTNTATKTGFTGRCDSVLLDKTAIVDFFNVADVNNDGKYDLITACWYHPRVMQGDSCVVNPDDGKKEKPGIYYGTGKNTFIYWADEALNQLPPMPVAGLPTDDFNHDGKLDIFFGTWYSSWCLEVMPKFYLQSASAGFTEMATQLGLQQNNNGIFGATSTDWNNDGWNDILTCHYDTLGYGNLFCNLSGNFTDKGAEANFNPYALKGDNGQPMVPWEAMPCDFDNDGDIDFAVALVHGGTEPGEGRTCILENTGKENNYTLKPRYDIILRKYPQDSHHGDHRLTWCDINNDGWADLLIADGGYAKGIGIGRLHICLQHPQTHQLIDMTDKMMLTDSARNFVDESIREPFAVETSDMDMDGDEEIIVSKTPGLGIRILNNETGNQNNWIKIKLVAPPGVNSDCIGARVYIKTKNFTQIREISSGQGQFSSHSTTGILHVGLGSQNKVEEIRIVWPGKVPDTRVKKVKTNRLVTIGLKGIQPKKQKN